MAHAISVETHLAVDLAEVAHEAGPLLFHGRIRADFVSLVAPCEDEGRGGDDAEGLGHGSYCHKL